MMSVSRFSNYFAIFLAALALSAETSQGLTYKAAVVEYAPVGSVWNDGPLEVIAKNLDNYVSYVKEAASQAVDLIVFPEYGITTLGMPADREHARSLLQQIPPLGTSASDEICQNVQTSSNESLVFSRLSCAARENGIYIVANMGEIVPCEQNQIHEDGVCPEDDAFQFNTDVVFDRQGRLIARYRKTHLFLEPQFQTPELPDHVTFTTDFGVTFGVLTCFDIVFYEPAIPLYNESGIRDFVFPTAWVDELPYLTAVQMQNAWARSLGVNLIASGYHSPAGGQLGSGIFNPSGPLNYTFDPTSGSRLLVAQVDHIKEMPNEIPAEEDQDVGIGKNKGLRITHAMLYEDLSNYSSVLLNKTDHAVPQDSLQLCHDSLCCSLNYSASFQGSTTYRLLAYSGQRSLGGGLYHVEIQLCGIVACSSEDLTSCGRDVTKTADFGVLQIGGNFSTPFVYPTYINKDLQLFDNSDVQFSKFQDNRFTIAGSNRLIEVLSVGLYGRVYDRD